MALSSDALDIAIICSSKAMEFEGKDSRFEVVHGVICNSEIILMKDYDNKKIGVSSGRIYEKDMVDEILGEQYTPFAMNVKGLTYALEAGNVGGIVIDYFNSSNLEGDRIYPESSHEFSIFSIIISKSFKDSREYVHFRETYNETVTYLSQGNNILSVSGVLTGDKNADERRINQWRTLNTKIKILEE